MVDKVTTETTAYITQYRLEVDEYKDNAKRYRLAKALLAFWIDPTIRGRVINISKPNGSMGTAKSSGPDAW